MKPRFNSNYMDINNKNFKKNKNGINQIKEKLNGPNNNFYNDKRNKAYTDSNLSKDIKESSYNANTNINHIKSYENNILTNKNNINNINNPQNFNNYQYCQNDQIKFKIHKKKMIKYNI